jgi:hypothetical protein
MAFGLDSIIGAGLEIINKFIKDPKEAAQAQIEMMRIKQAESFKEIEAALQEKQMQADINKTEASHESIFVAGWRPFIGWVCGLSIALQFLIFPLLSWGFGFAGYVIMFPELPSEMLYGMIFGMLGIGGMRSYEKTKGTSKKRVGG